MKIADLLTEGLSPILYHYASVPSIINILKTNTLKLSSSLSKKIESDYSKGKYFYFSTTRSRVGAYHFSHGSKKALPHTAVLLKLDGRALSSVVSGTPTDYWGRDFRKISPTKNEMEDRILSDKPEIPNAKKYILSVECFYDEERQSDYGWHNQIKEVISLCLQKGIEVNLYLSQQDFITGKRALKNQDAMDRVNFHGPELERHTRDRESLLAPYIELLTKDDPSELSEKASRVLRNLSYGYGIDDEVRRFQTDFHNENQSDDSRQLTVIAKKIGAKTLKDILIYIKNKFNKKAD